MADSLPDSTTVHLILPPDQNDIVAQAAANDPDFPPASRIRLPGV